MGFRDAFAVAETVPHEQAGAISCMRVFLPRMDHGIFDPLPVCGGHNGVSGGRAWGVGRGPLSQAVSGEAVGAQRGRDGGEGLWVWGWPFIRRGGRDWDLPRPRVEDFLPLGFLWGHGR